MAKYTIVVKRGSLEYSLSGDDKAFIAAHIHEVFAELKTREQNRFEQLTSAIKIENPLKNIDKQPENEVEQQVEKGVENVPEQWADKVQAEAPLAPKAETMDALEFLFQPKKEEHAEQAPAPSEDPVQNNEEPQHVESHEFIENVFIPKRGLSEDATEPEHEQQEERTGFDFGDILEQKMQAASEPQSAVYEDAPPVVEDYESFVKNNSPESLTDYLVITAYYMLENEGISKFAIKQLNQKLFSSMKLLVDNKTAQNALERGFIEIVADFSENGITEYALTENGRNYYINGFK